VSIHEQEQSLASVAVGDSPSATNNGDLSEPPAGAAPTSNGEASPPPATLAAQHGLSLASIEARWPAIVERFQGNVFAKVLLLKLVPAQLEESRVTFAGRVTALDLIRLEDACRRPVEDLLAQELGVQLRVRFAAAEESSSQSLDDFASGLFGGQIVSG